jgi:predicted DNA-binding WGR domain protein
VSDALEPPVRDALLLCPNDPEQGMARFYSLIIERDLSDTVRMVRAQGRIDTSGQELRSTAVTAAAHDDEVHPGRGADRPHRRRGPRNRKGSRDGECLQPRWFQTAPGHRSCLGLRR